MNHSQNQEQDAILNYFNGYVGTFIDIGANDGITLSNTRALAELGWRGVLVEPSPSAFERLDALYKGHKGFYTYQFALGGHNGKGILQDSGQLLGKGDVALVSTFNASEMERFKGTVQYSPVEVKVFKWKTFINRLSIKEFDFVSLDIEGNELQVLPDMDLSKTSCICLEWNSKPELKTEYEKYMDGFKLIYTSGENLIYGR